MEVVDVSDRLRESYHSQAREHLLRAHHDEGKQVLFSVVGLSRLSGMVMLWVGTFLESFDQN